MGFNKTQNCTLIGHKGTFFQWLEEAYQNFITIGQPQLKLSHENQVSTNNDGTDDDSATPIYTIFLR